MKKKIFFQIISIILYFSGHAMEYSITHDQYYVIPDNAENGWYLGKFHENISDKYLYNRVGNYSFTIISGNPGRIFSINASTGLITVYSNSAFYGNGTQDYTLEVEVSVDNVKNIAKAHIHVHDSSKCYFIDMDATVTGDGTLQSPYLRFSQIASLHAGEVAFLKRGTKGGPDERIELNVTNSKDNPFIVAAYGMGNKPIIENTTTTNRGVSCNTSYNYIFDIVTRNWNGNRQVARNGFYFKDITKGNKAFRCESSLSSGNGEFYVRPKAEVVLMDCRGWDNTSSHCYKFEGNNDTLISCYAKNAPQGNGFSFPSGFGGHGGYVAHSYVEGPFETGCMYIRKSHVTVAYNYFKGGRRIIDCDELADYETADTLHIHHNVFDTPQGQYAFRAKKADSLVFEDNIIRGCDANEKAMFIYEDCNKIYIRRNKIHDNANIGIEINNTNVSDVFIHNNLIYNNGTGILISQCGPNVNIYNNTIVKNSTVDVSNISGTNVEFRNNICEVLPSVNMSPFSNNVDLLEGDPFVNYDEDDFYPSSSSVIDAGYDYGASIDLEGNPVPQGTATDIGAYEYTTVSAILEENGQFSYYPVPVNEYLYLSGLGVKSLISVYDIGGRKLFNCFVNGSSVEKIDLRNLNTGFYYFMVQNEKDYTRSYKFIKN